MPETAKQRSIESYGLGQSGYTAGRVEGDRALEEQIEDRNQCFVNADEQVADLGDDDRFTGRSGRAWVPDPSKPEKESEE